MICPNCGYEFAPKGYGDQQAILCNESRKKIMQVLEDGRTLRFTELLKATKMSPATLSKHLKQLVCEKKVERKLDAESEGYPPPVYYRLILTTTCINEKVIKAYDEMRAKLTEEIGSSI